MCKCKSGFIIFSLFIFCCLQVLAQSPIRFAVIGDYGKTGANELAVSNLVDSWNAEFIITTGDNNYEYGGGSTIDSNIGYYYHEYIYPYIGIHGPGAPFNKFWPSLGNHDWDSLNALPYYNYFALPNNERYYEFTKGFLQFFVLDSDPREPDSVSVNSIQAAWLQNKLATSNARFRIVYFHHPPYSSGQHGSTGYMQWPFKQWGASIVLNGHDHTYERFNVGNFTYIVNGLGGKSIYNFDTVIQAGSIVRYNGNYGAQLVTAYNDSMVFRFYNIAGTLIDSYKLPYIPIGIIKIGNEVPAEFSLSQNYPNPFNPVTKIRFAIPSNVKSERSNVKLIIYDILGCEITAIVNENLKPGNYEIEWNAENYSNGVYYYQLTAIPSDRFRQSDGYIETKKMVLVK